MGAPCKSNMQAELQLREYSDGQDDKVVSTGQKPAPAYNDAKNVASPYTTGNDGGYAEPVHQDLSPFPNRRASGRAGSSAQENRIFCCQAVGALALPVMITCPVLYETRCDVATLTTAMAIFATFTIIIMCQHYALCPCPKAAAAADASAFRIRTRAPASQVRRYVDLRDLGRDLGAISLDEFGSNKPEPLLGTSSLSWSTAPDEVETTPSPRAQCIISGSS